MRASSERAPLRVYKAASLLNPRAIFVPHVGSNGYSQYLPALHKVKCLTSAVAPNFCFCSPLWKKQEAQFTRSYSFFKLWNILKTCIETSKVLLLLCVFGCRGTWYLSSLIRDHCFDVSLFRSQEDEILATGHHQGSLATLLIALFLDSL